MEKTHSTPSGDHDEIAMAKEPESTLYSAAEAHEKADDEVSVPYILTTYACHTSAFLPISSWVYSAGI